MKERPILFSGPMVNAILEGRKTQTRRVIRNIDGPKAWDSSDETGWPLHKDGRGRIVCPFGEIGSRLWVRETWQPTGVSQKLGTQIHYKAGGCEWRKGSMSVLPNRWRSPIHMPQWASRITLEVTGVRVERLVWVLTFKRVDNAP